MYKNRYSSQPVIPEHERVYHYVSGELHKYLGYHYPLSIIGTSDEPRVVLNGSHLVLYTKHPQDRGEIAFILDMWYREQAKAIFVPVVADAIVKAAAYKISLPKLRIYKLDDRWGSLSQKSKILVMNLELIKTPKPCIEYIALHEVIHARYPSHDMGFYSALSNLMPDWRERENILRTKFPI